MSRFVRAATLAACWVTAVAAPLTAQQTKAWQPLAREVYQQLIEINTSNMTSGTTVAAEAMAKRFRDAGFPEQDIFLGGVRADKHNLVVRYHGKGGANAPKPLMLLAHLDVVEALRSDWSPDLEPFKLAERDGFFYGRGTTDDKAQAAAWVAILLQFKKEGYVPDRDIVLALTADEEGGCCNGARWLVQNHRDLVDVGLILNEGGFGYLRNGKPQSNVVEATQKVVVTFTVTAKNPGGHSSLPRPDNAIYQLAAGLYRFSSFGFPVEFNPVNKAYFEKTALVESPENAAAMRAIVKDPADAKALAVLSRDPLYNSTLRTTCVATMLKGGHATNALPQTAEATINCRMVPTSKPSIVRDAIVKALADTGLIVSEATNREPPAPSPLLPDVFGTIESITKDMWGNIPVIPTMMTGATDAQPWRALGVPAYGVSGIMLDMNDLRAHGRDERLPVKSFYDGQEFMYRLTRALSSQRVVP